MGVLVILLLDLHLKVQLFRVRMRQFCVKSIVLFRLKMVFCTKTLWLHFVCVVLCGFCSAGFRSSWNGGGMLCRLRAYVPLASGAFAHRDFIVRGLAVKFYAQKNCFFGGCGAWDAELYG